MKLLELLPLIQGRRIVAKSSYNGKLLFTTWWGQNNIEKYLDCEVKAIWSEIKTVGSTFENTAVPTLAIYINDVKVREAK